MRKLIEIIASRISAMAFSDKAQIEDGRETAAMVYVGDIYAVLLRNRAARLLSQEESRRLACRREDGWPFIR